MRGFAKLLSDVFMTVSLRYTAICCVLIAFSLSTGHKVNAQTTVGLQPLGSYANGGIDQINLATLGLHIDIPLYTHKGRGDGMGAAVHLVYDTDYVYSGDGPITERGWRVQAAAAPAGSATVTPDYFDEEPLPCDDGSSRCGATMRTVSYAAAFADATGYIHPFYSTAASVQCIRVTDQDCTPVNLAEDEYAYDDSGYRLQINPGISSPVPQLVKVTTPTGAVYYSGTSLSAPYYVDVNGNQGIYFINDGRRYWNPWNTVLTDDTGIGPTISGGQYSSQNSQQWTSRAPLIVTYTDTNGNPQSVYVNYSLHSVTVSCQSTGFNYTATIGLADSVTYPDGSSYHFTYQTDGQLASMQLPTGGTITYESGDFCQFQRDGRYPEATSRIKRTTMDGTTSYVAVAVPTAPYSVYASTSSTTVSKPDGSSEQISFNYDFEYEGPIAGLSNRSYETAHTWSDASGTALKSTSRCYNGDTGDCTSSTIVTPISEILTQTTLGSVTSKTDEFLNQAGAQTQFIEYDYGATAATRYTGKQYTQTAGGSLLLLPTDVSVYDHVPTGSNSPVALSDTELSYNGSQVANEMVALFQANRELTTINSFDSHGQMISTLDPLGHSTSFGYDSSTDNCLTSVTPPSVNNVSHATSSTCDPSTGLVLTSTDANGVVTSYSYDAMLRLTGAVSRDAVNNLVAQKSVSYSSGAPYTITTTTSATPDPDQVSVAVLDGLGRTTQVVAADQSKVDTTYDVMGRVQSVSNPYFSTGDATYGITSYLYDGLGRRTFQCQPDNAAATTVCNPTKSYLSWTYADNTVTSRDEAGNQWKRQTDALGRLTSVLEPSGTSATPLLETDYTYDALSNLLSVTQWGGAQGTAGARVRSFSYDSASRLLCASNPENSSASCPATASSAYIPGTVGYSYDDNGNLLYKTDARGVTTSYTYDALNRLTFKSYSDSTHIVGFGYDGNSPNGSPLSQQGVSSANAIGRLSQVTTLGQSVDSVFSYDAMGRVTAEGYCLPSNPCNRPYVNAQYDLAGNMTSLTYPDGRIVSQSYDGAGRVSMTGDGTNTQAYLQSMTYNPDGSPSQLTLGNGIVQNWSQNNRLQVNGVSVADGITGATYLSHTYCYVNCPSGGTANNGNLWQITDNLSSLRTQAFTYDNLNRISSFSLGGVLAQQYAIDSFGNLSGMANGQHIQTFDPATNRISNLPCAASAQPYDAAGNQLCDTDQNGAISQYSFDAENRISQVNTLNNAASPFVAYTYAADSTRALKQNADGTFTEYINFNGQTIAEKDQTGAWTDHVFAGGKRIAIVSPTQQVIHIQGLRDSSRSSACGTIWYVSGQPSPLSGYVIQPGDRASFEGLSTFLFVGAALTFSDGSFASNMMPVDQQWHQMSIDLSNSIGKTVSNLVVGPGEPYQQQGNWDAYFKNIVLSSADGSVHPLFTGGLVSGVTPTDCGSYQLVFETKAVQVGGPFNVKYYLGDHLGSAQMEFSASGIPLSMSQFMPFGAEITPVVTANHYKFTGKERDSESGLDYFGARYFGSLMGRFMSPDWSASADPVPYARMDNPQSLNLYAYVGNNPLSRRDGDGHSPCGGSANITINVNSNGTSSMSQTADCPDNSSWMMFAGLIGGGVGHHYIPQSISNGFNNLTQRFSNNITSGSLADKTVNYYDKLHRAYNDRVAKVLAQYLQDTGKNIKQLTTSDIKAIVQRMKNAGGEIEDFNTRLTTANPGVRSMEEGVEHAAQAVSESGAAKAAEEFIEECEMGAPCIPPI